MGFSVIHNTTSQCYSQIVQYTLKLTFLTQKTPTLHAHPSNMHQKGQNCTFGIHGVPEALGPPKNGRTENNGGFWSLFASVLMPEGSIKS